MKKALVLMTLACFQANHGAYQAGRGKYGSVFEVCEGQTISLQADFKNRIVTETTVLRDDSNEMMVFKDGTVQKCYHRATCIDSTAITIKDAIVTDSGIYDFHVSFANNQSDWITYEVTVLEGCPDQTEFYGPTIQYRLDTGALELLPDTRLRPIEVEQESTVILNITLPVARPQVACSIISDNKFVVENRSRSFGTYQFTRLNVTGGPTVRLLAEVKLSHPDMDQPFSSSVFYRSKGEPADRREIGEPPSGHNYNLTIMGLAVVFVLFFLILVAMVFLLQRCIVLKNTAAASTSTQLLTSNEVNSASLS